MGSCDGNFVCNGAVLVVFAAGWVFCLVLLKSAVVVVVVALFSLSGVFLAFKHCLLSACDLSE